MNKTLFSGSLVCVITLMFGSVLFPHNLLMELAGTSVTVNFFRGVVAVILLAVLFTSPPRRWALRAGMGIFAITLMVIGVMTSFGNSMHLLDAILYLQLSCALGMEALEFNEDELLHQTSGFQDLYKQQHLNQTQHV